MMEAFLIKLEEIVDRKFKVDSSGGSYRFLVFLTDAKVPKLMSNVRKDKKYVVLGNSNLPNKLLKAGRDCYLDKLCF